MMNPMFHHEELMKDYKVEFRFKSSSHFKSLVVVADPKNDEEFVSLCDSVYNDNFREGKELSVYFFRNVESAAKFTYLELVQNENEDQAIPESNCIGYLIKNSFSVIKDKPALIKRYSC